MIEVLLKETGQALVRLTTSDLSTLESLAAMYNSSLEEALANAIDLAHTVGRRKQLMQDQDGFVESVLTPWGMATQVLPVGPGIVFVRTPRSNGLHIMEPALHAIPAELSNLMRHPCWVENKVYDVEVALFALSRFVAPELLNKALPHLLAVNSHGQTTFHSTVRDALERYGRYRSLTYLLDDIPVMTAGLFGPGNDAETE